MLTMKCALLVFVFALTVTTLLANPTGRLASFKSHGGVLTQNVFTSRKERFDKKPGFADNLHGSRVLLGPRWNLPSHTDPGSFVVTRHTQHPEAETEAGAGGEAGAMTAAQMLRLLRRLQPGPGARQLKWGFW